ncbi:MAG: dTDP-4-amino-4,6-dideoxygalactose transaminase [Vicinamibacteria bacterium]
MSMVPFNSPGLTGRELDYIAAVIDSRHLSGNGAFTRRCHAWLEQALGARRVLLTQSCTAALEMAALLSGVGPGDEVIMPSFTFVSTANAFVLRGATPVFVDVRPDTLNLDERRVDAAVGPRTRAIVPVHYAGVGCDMAALQATAARHGLLVIEDAAQGLMAERDGRPLGSFGEAAALSFHETKNIISGEGGALIVNEPSWVARAEILWEKGTNRAAFHRGEVDKYTWCDVGSSFLPSELTAAFLLAQLEHASAITDARLAVWRRYHDAFAALEAEERLRRPIVPDAARANGHIYYLLFPTAEALDAAVPALRAAGVDAVRHYVPLHSSPAGRRLGRTAGDLPVTDDVSGRLVRLPLWAGMSDAQVEQVIDAVWQVASPGASRPR